MQHLFEKSKQIFDFFTQMFDYFTQMFDFCQKMSDKPIKTREYEEEFNICRSR